MAKEKKSDEEKPKVEKVTKEVWEKEYSENFMEMVETINAWKEGKTAMPYPEVKKIKKALADLRKVKPREVSAGEYSREGLVYCSLTKEQKVAVQALAKAESSSVAGIIKPFIIKGLAAQGLAEFQ